MNGFLKNIHGENKWKRQLLICGMSNEQLYLRRLIAMGVLDTEAGIITALLVSKD